MCVELLCLSIRSAVCVLHPTHSNTRNSLLTILASIPTTSHINTYQHSKREPNQASSINSSRSQATHWSLSREIARPTHTHTHTQSHASTIAPCVTTTLLRHCHSFVDARMPLSHSNTDTIDLHVFAPPSFIDSIRIGIVAK